MIDLDDLDWRILRALQKNNRQTYAQLAEEVASSPASCLRRVKSMRGEGLIIADICLLNQNILTETLIVIVNVELERERLDLVDAFKRDMLAAEEVTQCYMVTGEADFVLIVSVSSVTAFDTFVRTKLYTNPNVRKFRSMICIDRVKFEPRINF